MSSIRLLTYADLAYANNCVYFRAKERYSEAERCRGREGGGFIDQG